MHVMAEEEEPLEEEPIGAEEAELLRQDLVDVQALKELLGSRGIKGVVFYCPDCGEDHFLAWDLLAGNLKELLEEGESPVHEPAFDPDPNEYVSWDYARGFLDGYESYDEELDDGLAGLVIELEGKGLSRPEIARIIRAAGFEMPQGEDPRASR
jgi:Family of unknown function (DUF5319)